MFKEILISSVWCLIQQRLLRWIVFHPKEFLVWGRLVGLCLLSLGSAATAAGDFEPMPMRRSESQAHGFRFEEWVRDTFFDGYQPDRYSQTWDIPASVNGRYGGLPINPKMVKYGSPVDLGDARRQFEIAQGSEPFLLLIAYWEQVTPQRKKIVNTQVIQVTPAQYQTLWGNITADDLERLEEVIRDRRLTVHEARERARQILREPPFLTAPLRLHPKVDATQRRLQCSLSFARVFRFLAPEGDSSRQAQPRLFGVAVPEFHDSPPRMRRTERALPWGEAEDGKLPVPLLHRTPDARSRDGSSTG